MSTFNTYKVSEISIRLNKILREYNISLEEAAFTIASYGISSQEIPTSSNCKINTDLQL